MYLGIDFLIAPDGKPWVVEVNVGLPGGAEEIDRIHRHRCGCPSGIFDRIETVSLRASGRPFREFLESQPYIPALKAFKLWMDGDLRNGGDDRADLQGPGLRNPSPRFF